MLVLTRAEMEAVRIGDNIVVTVIRISPEKVKLGIEAPTSVPVHRQEVFESIQRENSKLTKACSPVKAEACDVNAELLAAAKKVLDHLNLRIVTNSNAGLPVPIFDGIADLHTAIAKAEQPQ